jgi:hypothetical protein
MEKVDRCDPTLCDVRQCFNTIKQKKIFNITNWPFRKSVTQKIINIAMRGYALSH